MGVCIQFPAFAKIITEGTEAMMREVLAAGHSDADFEAACEALMAVYDPHDPDAPTDAAATPSGDGGFYG
jgi:hypothetical protein